jgi:DmsE family decaheme c-type cytochrome
MRNAIMASRLNVAIVTLALLAGGFAVARTQQNPYRLKQPDQRKLCLDCHSDFEATLKKQYVHSAVQAGDCASCHSPHVSSHGKLLSADPSRVCATCHEDMVPAAARSVHKVVADGQCAKCHDPHASDNPANLVARGNDLCVSCHKEIGDAITKAKFKHSPVGQGCTSCHTPHASEQSTSLLKTAMPDLCVKCHKTDGPSFVSRHMRYPSRRRRAPRVDPHGSNQPALMLNSVHAPVSGNTLQPVATRRFSHAVCDQAHGLRAVQGLPQRDGHGHDGRTASLARRQSAEAARTATTRRRGRQAAQDNTARSAADATKTPRARSPDHNKHTPVQDGLCVVPSPQLERRVLIDQPRSSNCAARAATANTRRIPSATRRSIRGTEPPRRLPELSQLAPSTSGCSGADQRGAMHQCHKKFSR